MAFGDAKYLDAIKWPKPCATCGVIVDTKGWLFNHQLYCEKHKPQGEAGKPTEGAGGGVATATHSNSTPSSSTPKAVVVTKMCDTCHSFVDETTLIHVLRVGGDRVDLMICERCNWLYHAQWGLKVHGMWRPTPKPEAKQ